jgi:hypothetical protein
MWNRFVAVKSRFLIRLDRPRPVERAFLHDHLSAARRLKRYKLYALVLHQLRMPCQVKRFSMTGFGLLLVGTKIRPKIRTRCRLALAR